MHDIRVPGWFKAISVLALLWNVLGLFTFFGSMLISGIADDVSQMIEQSIQQNFPVWAKIANGLAAIGGTIGCLGLVLRKKWAYPLLVASLIGILGQTMHTILFSSAWELDRWPIIILSGITILISMLLIWMSRIGIYRKWLV